MTTQDQIKKLMKYQTEVNNKMTSETPEKHKNRASEYKQFLARELEMVSTKIASLKEGKGA